MSKCVFCEFVSKQTRKSHTVFEDDVLLAILDDFPKSKGHTLVILKEHQPDITSVSPEAAASMGRVVARIATAIKDSLEAELVYVASVGEQVQHAHYHLIPRYKSDGKGFIHFMSSRGKLIDGEKLAKLIRIRLENV